MVKFRGRVLRFLSQRNHQKELTAIVDMKRWPKELAPYTTPGAALTALTLLHTKAAEFAGHIVNSAAGQCDASFVLAIGFDKGHSTPSAMSTSSSMADGAAVIMSLCGYLPVQTHPNVNPKSNPNAQSASQPLASVSTLALYTPSTVSPPDELFFRNVRRLAAEVLFPEDTKQTSIASIELTDRCACCGSSDWESRWVPTLPAPQVKAIGG